MSFGPEMANISQAGFGLGGWVKNIIGYWDVIQIIVPLRKQVKETESRLNTATT